ncbi:rab proteins geranylgeranyltransferase component A 2-like [Etheostoma cragini]|uniref:rab proteins geranylgeranyltransferase component A 2-like n=1 Tax=Etheostoma cragini TaxID=417921 RepID=UPI00155F36CF|nr:rab proteins geranylgeranyltransferase component A 2-like [Etheostoma cragini]
MAAEDLPSEFDVVILGTGLAESVVAAAFSRVGQRVLHLDRRSYYAANWASFTFNALLTWIREHQEESQLEEVQDWSSLLEEGEELIYLKRDSACITNLQVFCYASEEEEEEEAPTTTEEEQGADEEVKETPETESAGMILNKTKNLSGTLLHSSLKRPSNSLIQHEGGGLGPLFPQVAESVLRTLLQIFH